MNSLGGTTAGQFRGASSAVDHFNVGTRHSDARSIHRRHFKDARATAGTEHRRLFRKRGHCAKYAEVRIADDTHRSAYFKHSSNSAARRRGWTATRAVVSGIKRFRGEFEALITGRRSSTVAVGV